jgi:YVTN family beta-propeller protein
MKNFIGAAALAAVALSLVFCSGGTTAPQLVGEIPIPNNPASFTYDIGWADQTGHYFITDRTNKSVDMIDTTTLAVTAVITGGATPFTGIGANSDKSGPDGIIGIPGTTLLYVGDVSSVKIVDSSLQKVIANIKVNPPGSGTPSGYRADEGCYDPDDKLMMFAHPGDSPPFATWIDTTTNTVKAQFVFTDSIGLEQCGYDPGTKSFYLNNDGTTANPQGEVDVFLASSVKTGTPVLAKTPYPLPKCNPTGLAMGPGTDMLVACAQSAGDPLTSLILNRATGATVATVKLGGADQVAYDSVSNRYFMALRYWSDSGISTNGSTTPPSPQYNPILGVVDAGSYAIVAKLPAGGGDHSVAVDGANHRVFVPHSTGVAAFPAPGITVYSTQ